MSMELEFTSCGYGNDFEAVCDWPDGWPYEYDNEDVWFKAYDTSLCENDEDRKLFSDGYLYNCKVSVRYDTDSLYCEDFLAKFPARDRAEAERLLNVAAEALYAGPWYGKFVVEHPEESYEDFDTLEKARERFDSIEPNDGEYVYLFRDVWRNGYLDQEGIDWKERA